MSSNSTNITTTLTVGLDPIEQWVLLIFFYLFGGTITSLAYVLVAIGIGRTKKLRTRFFAVLWSLVVCRAFILAQFTVIGTYRTLRTLQIAPSKLSSAACNMVHFWLLYGLTLEITLLLILVLDRALAIMSPSFYRMLTSKQAMIICVMTYLVVFILKVPFAFVDVKAKEVTCVNSYSTPSDIFNDYTQNIDLAILCLTLLVYVILFISVKRKISSLRAKGTYNNQSTDSIALKRQLELMPTLRNLVLLHCGLSMVTRILRASSGMKGIDPYMSARLSAYAGLFTVVDLFVNLVALLWGNAKVRRATFPCRIQMPVQEIGTVTEYKGSRTISRVGPMNTSTIVVAPNKEAH